MTGVLGSAVTGSPAITGSPALGVTNLTGVLPVGVTGGSGLTALGTVASGTIGGSSVINTSGTITSSAGITETGGVLKQNLLTNSGFDVWSNSGLTSGDGVGRTTDYNVSNILTDTDGSSYASWTATRCTVTDGGSNLLITETSANQNIVYVLSGLTIGKLYKCSFTCSDGTGVWGDESTRLDIAPNGGGTALASIPIDDAGTYSVIWEATEVNNQLYFVITSMGTGATVTIDDLYVDEVTPGCVAADALGPDGWYKPFTTLDLLRQHNDGGTLTHDGSFYSLKAVKGANTQEVLVHGVSLTDIQRVEHYQRFAGRTVTIGAWVWADTSDNVRLRFWDGGETLSTSHHPGGSAWEWMELTDTVQASPSGFSAGFDFDGDSGDTAYISQPMLVFGSSIGEGNYTRPVGEVIWFEKSNGVVSNKFNNLDGYSSSSNHFVRPDSNGVIPKGTRAIYTSIAAETSTVEDTISIRANSIGGSNGNQLRSQVANISMVSCGWSLVESTVDGQVRVSQGSGTYNDLRIEYMGVKLY
jgi:hypothetical protein